VAQGALHRRRRRRRSVEDAGVVQEREEQMEDVLARRFAADVAAEKVGHALEQALAHGGEAGLADVADRSEQP
jgi:hypothetical protein